MKNLFFCIFLFLPFFTSHAYAVDCSAEAACLIVGETGEIIFEKNAYEKLPMASTTKIMTALLALEKSSPDDIVTVSANAAAQEGSSVYLEKGDKIRMEDLIYALMLNSGNDAAMAVAEYISGTAEAFAEDMTSLAGEIGAENTVFKNPSGLYEDGHHTTAYDLAAITSYALNNPHFRQIVSTPQKEAAINNADKIYLKNHNKLLTMYNGAIGVKTGYTKKCGRCLVSAAERNGICLICVTLNDPDDWNDHISMLDYGFADSKYIKVLSREKVFKTAQTADKREIGCYSAEDITIPVYSDTPPDAKIITHLCDNLKAPIKRGEKIGTAELMIGSKFIKSFDILCDREITQSKKNIFFNAFLRVINKWRKICLQ